MRIPSAPSAILLLLLTAAHSLAAADEYASLSSAQLASRADLLLSSGHGQNALELYDILVSRDRESHTPSFLNLYKRGTAYLSIGQNARALDDLEAVLALHELEAARLASIRLYLKFGDHAQASQGLQVYRKTAGSTTEVEQLEKEVKKLKKSTADANRSRDSGNWESCIEHAGQALETSTQYGQMLATRAACQSQMGRVEEAIADLSRAVSLSPNSPSLLMPLTILNSLFLLPSSTSLAPIKQCLHFDPDSKPCKRLFRSLKRIEKDYNKAKNFVESKGWRTALGILDPKGADSTGLSKSVTEIMEEFSPKGKSQNSSGEEEDPSIRLLIPSDDKPSQLLTQLYGWTCKAYTSTSSVRLAKPFCTQVLERDPENIDGITGMGELHLSEENYSEAVRLLSSAFEATGRSDRSLLEKLQKAQRLHKQSTSKDYYKVLGVARDADTKTIRRAYKKAAVKAHPDKEGGSEAKMAAVNEAWEVLGNEELRARFDNGDDPNDPQSQHAHAQHGGQGHPFFAQGGGAGGQNAFFQQFFQQGQPRRSHQEFKFTWG